MERWGASTPISSSTQLCVLVGLALNFRGVGRESVAGMLSALRLPELVRHTTTPIIKYLLWTLAC